MRSFAFINLFHASVFDCKPQDFVSYESSYFIRALLDDSNVMPISITARICRLVNPCEYHILFFIKVFHWISSARSDQLSPQISNCSSCNSHTYRIVANIFLLISKYSHVYVIEEKILFVLLFHIERLNKR